MDLSIEHLLLPLRTTTAMHLKIGIGCDPATPKESVMRTIQSPVFRGLHMEFVEFEDPEVMISALKEGRISGAVRGTLSAGKTMNLLRAEFSLPKVVRLALLETDNGRKGFALAPVGIDEGRTIEERLEIIRMGADFLQRFMGIRTPGIGVLSFGREEDASRDNRVALSLREGKEIVEQARKHGLNAAHYGILIEEAVKEADLILAPDGPSGNLIFRTLHYLMGGRAVGAPVLNLDGVFVDTSRGHWDFVDAAALAAFLAVNFQKG